MENPYESMPIVATASSQQSEEETATACPPSHRWMKRVFGFVVAALVLANVALATSPSLLEKVGQFVPDSFAPASESFGGHDRGCGCPSAMDLDRSGLSDE